MTDNDGAKGSTAAWMHLAVVITLIKTGEQVFFNLRESAAAIGIFLLHRLGLAAAVALLSRPTTASEPRCFPADFLFGSATASYQVEGAWNEDGRTPSIWDDFCREQPGFQCANVADDFYHRYADDIKLMVETGLQSFRFSVSWSRMMNWDPDTRHMRPNAPERRLEATLELHNELTELVMRTLTSLITSCSTRHCSTKSSATGRRPVNEPLSFVVYGYNTGLHPPGFHDSPTLVYKVAHNVLLSHGYAVQKFRELKASRFIQSEARIGIVFNANQFYPVDANNPSDVEATERAMNFEFGWWLLPITTGDYPAVMRERVGDRLPRFTADQAAVLKGLYDVFMLNHYYSRAVTDCDSEASNTPCSSLHVGFGQDKESYTAYPPGYLDTIKWMHAKDPSAKILLTENGWCGDDEVYMYKAVVEEKLPVIGYTAWSFLDNYEWGSYGPRFGLCYVNFTEETGSPDFEKPKQTDLQRIARPSAKWFSKVASTGCLDELLHEVQAAAIAMRAAAREAPSVITGTASSSELLFVGVVIAVVGAAMLAAATWRRRQGYATIPRFSAD
ncbi:Glycosyl hydrolases family 1, N-terminal conserved site [Phytophthora cactorum]|nr:Glycosyl hydrolases family 1, N-terminal conserved site [Phytophthora cactorum]